MNPEWQVRIPVEVPAVGLRLVAEKAETLIARRAIRGWSKLIFGPLPQRAGRPSLVWRVNPSSLTLSVLAGIEFCYGAQNVSSAGVFDVPYRRKRPRSGNRLRTRSECVELSVVTMLATDCGAAGE